MRLAPTGHRPIPEIYRGYFVPITHCLESLVRYYPPGLFSSAYRSMNELPMPYPCLLAWP